VTYLETRIKQASLGLQRGYSHNATIQNQGSKYEYPYKTVFTGVAVGLQTDLGRMFGSVTSLACTNWKIYERVGSLASILLQ
jgi:hypothetical protein